MSLMLMMLLLLLAGQAGQSTVVQGPTPNTLRLVEGAPRPGARVTEFSWLTGAWVGEGLGGEVEEVWSAPVGGSMVGHFRLVRDGQPVFYELLTLIEVDGSVEMRLKHMNPDMTGWEEKNEGTVLLPRALSLSAYFSMSNGQVDGGDFLRRMPPPLGS